MLWWDLRKLGSKHRWKQQEAIEKLSFSRDSRIVERIIALLKKKNPNLRRAAIIVLGRIGDKRAVEPLLLLLQNEDDVAVWQEATQALEMIQSSQLIEPMIAALKDPDSIIRQTAATVLGRLGDKRAVEPLLVLLQKEENGEVWCKAAPALEHISTHRLVAPMITALKAPDNRIRQVAATILGRSKSTRAVEELVAALDDKDSDVRWAVVESLADRNERRVLRSLIAFSDKKDTPHYLLQMLKKYTKIMSTEDLCLILSLEDVYSREYHARSGTGAHGESYNSRWERTVKQCDYAECRKASRDELLRRGFNVEDEALKRLVGVGDCTRVIELNPTDAIAYVNRGDNYEHLHRYDKALADYTKAIELDPVEALAYASRGITYAKVRQQEEALMDLKQAIELDRDLLVAHLSLGHILANERMLQDDLSFAFETFSNTDSLAEMRQALTQSPWMAEEDFIASVEQAAKLQIPPHLEADCTQRLAWLRQTAQERG